MVETIAIIEDVAVNVINEGFFNQSIQFQFENNFKYQVKKFS